MITALTKLSHNILLKLLNQPLKLVIWEKLLQASKYEY